MFQPHSNISDHGKDWTKPLIRDWTELVQFHFMFLLCTTLDLIPNYSMHALRDTQGKFKGIVLFGLEYQVLVHSP